MRTRTTSPRLWGTSRILGTVSPGNGRHRGKHALTRDTDPRLTVPDAAQPQATAREAVLERANRALRDELANERNKIKGLRLQLRTSERKLAEMYAAEQERQQWVQRAIRTAHTKPTRIVLRPLSDTADSQPITGVVTSLDQTRTH